MIVGLLAVVLFDLAGELVARALRVPLPGPVIGMLLLLAALFAKRGLAARVEQGADLLLRHMSLFFVPAAVGVVTESDLLRAEALPIVVSLAFSTLLALVAAAWAFMLAAHDRR